MTLHVTPVFMPLLRPIANTIVARAFWDAGQFRTGLEIQGQLEPFESDSSYIPQRFNFPVTVFGFKGGYIATS